MGAERTEEGRGNAPSLSSYPARQAPPADATPRIQATGKVLLAVPERPSLAPGIRLAGQMPDSGYKDPPWLLEREGEGYVQVTELLYRLAEQCTGQQTIDEIAAAVSQATGRGVSPDNVRQLLAQQFLARGLIVSADGRVVQGPSGARSLLAMRMKTKTVPAEVVGHLASPLSWFFFPLVLVAVLFAVAALQVWVFFVHGVAGAVHQTFYTGGLALAVIVLVVLAAAIHELGHAAALRYGGGKPGGMGMGLYLVYPAFYTDVTDNYRLSRWSRLRTDLGGFYFNLLFVLVLAGVYALTGWEFMLLVIALINFQIIHQLLPFVRMDGYWTLVDLTGVPDFFQQMPAFFRSLIPSWVPGKRDRTPSPLRWWARLILGLYIAITIPLLLFLLLVTAVTIPRIFATAFDAAGQQWGDFTSALSEGDVVGIVLHPLQTLLILLPVAGSVLILSSVVRRLGGRLIAWSAPSWPRRVAGFGTAGVVAALLLLAWVPNLGLRLPGSDEAIVPAASYKPIGPDERGTLADSDIPVVRAVGPGDDTSGADEEQDEADDEDETPSPTPEGSPTGTATPDASASASPSTTATPTPAPSTATPTPAAAAPGTVAPAATAPPAEPTAEAPQTQVAATPEAPSTTTTGESP